MTKKDKPKKPSPKPETLEIKGENWENDLKKAISKKKPKNCWRKKNKKQAESS